MKRTIRIKTTALLLFCFVFQSLTFAPAQRIDATIHDRIRKEATDNSQIMRTLHFLTDVYGPRLTGSPNHRAAAEWAVKQMKDWGFDNAQLEAWDFGHPGWLIERALVWDL